jgi:hypothetical protein
MAHHISQLESELQNIPEAAPKASPSFSVSEKLARYGSSELSGASSQMNCLSTRSAARARGVVLISVGVWPPIAKAVAKVWPRFGRNG